MLKGTLKTLIICFIGFCAIASAQNTYSQLRQEALETMWKAKDERGYKKSLLLYEDAFSKFPDSVDVSGLYKASVLAGELKEIDKAFLYLTKLIEIDIDKNSGLSGWSSVVGKYAESEYKNLLNEPRWSKIKERALIKQNLFFRKLQEEENEFFSIKKLNSTNSDAIKLYKEMKSQNVYLPKKQRDYSISFKINESIKTSFLVHLPENYNPAKKYTLLFFLHGGVRSNALADYQPAKINLSGWNRYYTKYAEQNDVILVFPKGSKEYNWMLPDDGFFMIPEMLKLVKKGINVDDNKVFISGHSNGATGSFSYLVKQPTNFAGFYGFNTYPKVFTGGTFIENIKNRSFINFSTDEDYYYPPNANNDFTELMKNINADYKEHRYNGFPHWFPQFNESEPAYQILFSDLVNRKRNPFPKQISWEFDDNKYGEIDWISNIKLDTLGVKANWHKTMNFKIDKWLEYAKKDSLIEKKVDKDAFDFPRKSGKINAFYEKNVFRFETSNIKSFSINLSPEMVNMNRKIKIYVNGKLYFNEKIKYDTAFMLKNFEIHHDREQLWINSVKINL